MIKTSCRVAVSGLALALATVTLPAFAQDSATETPSSTDEVIVTAQRRNETQVTREGQVGVLGDQRAEDVPFSIKSYNSALILNQQPQTLGQVLENDPSFRTSYGFGNAAELFVVRGFPLFGDDIALNGLYGVTPRQLIAPELYDQVQVLNGASAFLNGAAPGGTGIGGNVNLISKRAGQEDLFRATANYTGDAHFGGSFDVSRRFGGDRALGVRINGAYRAGDVSVDDEFRRATVIGASVDWSSGALRVSGDIAYQRYEVRQLRPKVTVSTAVPRVPDADHNYGQAFTYTDLRDLFGSARIEYDVADDATLYVTGGARDTDEEGRYSGFTLSDATTGAGIAGASFIPFTSSNASLQSGLRVRLASGGITHQINVGGSHIWGVNRTAYEFYSNTPTNLYDTPQLAVPTTVTFAGGDLDDPFPISRSRLGSAFASDTIGFLGDRVLLTGGLRLQTITSKSYAYGDGSLQSARTDDAVTPVVGIVAKPTAGLSLYANRIESLAPGTTAGATVNYPGVGSVPITNVGEIFAPFKSVQYEVGAKLGIGSINASIAAFQIARPFTIATLDAGGASATLGVDGEQRHRGIEIGIDGELAPGLRLIAGGTIIDAELRRTQAGALDGNTARGVPDYTVNANLEWDLPFAAGLTLTGRVVQTGEQQVNDANTLEIGDWTRFDLGARYVAVVAHRPVTFRFNVDNVANERYWASAFDSSASALLQGAPRTFKASMSVDF